MISEGGKRTTHYFLLNPKNGMPRSRFELLKPKSVDLTFYLLSKVGESNLKRSVFSELSIKQMTNTVFWTITQSFYFVYCTRQSISSGVCLFLLHAINQQYLIFSRMFIIVHKKNEPHRNLGWRVTFLFDCSVLFWLSHPGFLTT